ncbi:hypothetical protein PLESTM_000315500 [Pleodorina starrii]|nr:hypothetical protein PLESTM_000315500 [Pleodorina starrii]
MVPYNPMLITDLLASQYDLPWDVIRLKPAPPQSPTAAEPSSSPLILRGVGSAMPPKWLNVSWDTPFNIFNDTAGFGGMFDGVWIEQTEDLPSVPPVVQSPPSPPSPSPPPSPLPPPPSPPPAPPRPPRGPSEEPPYTIIDWREWRDAPRPAIRLHNGQSLTMASMAFNVEYVEGAVTCGGVLRQPAFGLIQVDPGARLVLEDITAVLAREHIKSMLQELCQDPDTWPYTPDVVIGDGAIRIANFTSTAPGPDGSPGAGGQVQWRNVTLLYPGIGIAKPQACAAWSVADGQELGAVARRALSPDQTEGKAVVFLSVTGDVVALPADGSWVQVGLGQGMAGGITRAGAADHERTRLKPPQHSIVLHALPCATLRCPASRLCDPAGSGHERRNESRMHAHVSPE